MPTLSSADPVLETQVFWLRNKKVVLAGFIFAFLLVAAWGGYRLYSERRDGTASGILAAAKTAADFQKVIAQYPDTAAGASAYLFLAEAQRKEKKFSEANTTLQSFVDKYPTHELKGTARLAMAGNLESLGKRDEALAAYQRLVTEDPQGFVAPTALISEVPILKAKKQLDEARRACETLLSTYKDSLFASEAQRQLRLLKPPAPPETTPAPQTQSPAQILQSLVPSLRMRPSNLPAPTATAAAATTAAPASALPTAAPATDAPQTDAPPAQSKPKKRRRHR